MTFSYSGDLSNPLDYLRFKLNDKDSEAPIFSNEELNYFISKAPEAPTEKDLNRIALKLLKQLLGEIARGPSRERSGAYEVYGASAESLKLAIQQLESEIRSSVTPTPSFGGVNKQEVERNRSNDTYTSTKFYDSRIFGGS